MNEKIWTVELVGDEDNHITTTVSIHRTEEGAQRECDRLKKKFHEEYFVYEDELRD